jgi:hypothetical protein
MASSSFLAFSAPGVEGRQSFCGAILLYREIGARFTCVVAEHDDIVKLPASKGGYVFEFLAWLSRPIISVSDLYVNGIQAEPLNSYFYLSIRKHNPRAGGSSHETLDFWVPGSPEV